MFKVILTNGIEDVDLVFEVHKSNIAKKWFEELSKNYEIYESERFSNWGSSDTIYELNKRIDIINNYDNLIDVKVSSNITQTDLNYLHTFFENLRGEINQRTEWFQRAPENVKCALQEFNILIHSLEAELRTTNQPTCVVTFKNRPMLELTKDDMKQFTFRWITGTVYINYCHVGKTVLDVFKDNDTVSKAVRPQTHYSADFMIKFGPTSPYFFYLLRKTVISTWLKFQPFKFKNPNMGMIPVAKLVGDFNLEKLKEFKKIKTIICLK
jgi:virulence-associated protein VapD